MTTDTVTDAQINQMQLADLQNQLADLEAGNTAAISRQALQYTRQKKNLQNQIAALNTTPSA